MYSPFTTTGSASWSCPDWTAPISSALSAHRTYTVAGAGKSGVPSNATGVIVNATVLGGAVGYLQVWPGKQTRPATSVVNYASADKANAIVVALGSSGTISLYSMSSSKVHVILDVVGYLTDGSTLRAADPVRAVDTRSGSGHTGTISTSLSPRKVYAVDLSATVPADATGVVPNVIAIEPSANGNLRVYPHTNGKGTTSPPQASSLNYVPGRAIPNLVVVNLPANGKVDFYSDTSTRVHLAVDVVGYVTE